MIDEAAIARIDPFPFQHRVGDLMNLAAMVVDRDALLSTAIGAMARKHVSAVVVVDTDGRPAGIVTERDVLNCMAQQGAEGLQRPVSSVMSAPVHTVPLTAFVYLAIARMDRLGIRHLVAVEPETGLLVGLLHMPALLRQRAKVALFLGDEVAAAQSGADLAQAFRRIPELGRSLRTEGVPAHQVAAVISGVVRDMTARAGVIASQSMLQEGIGPAPADWCMLVLGSAGRGESLLATDQDNGLIHAGEKDDYPWFSEFGKRMSDLLDGAGIAYCRGGVMAARRDLRHNLPGWMSWIDSWLVDPSPRSILNADIFYDFVAVEGRFDLAADLRAYAVKAQQASIFLNFMAREIGEKSEALNWFGRFKTRRGRIDLKVGGLFPIVAGGRVLALRLGSTALSSRERWQAAFAAGIISEDDLAQLLDAHEMFLALILDQQLADLAAGLPASSEVEVKRLRELQQERLKRALHLVQQIDMIVRHALGEANFQVRARLAKEAVAKTPKARSKTLPE